MTETGRANPADPADDAPQDATPAMRDLVLDSLGGWRGFVDSALPSLAFIVANAIGGLGPASWAGGIVGVLLFLVRFVRRERVQQALSGLFVLALCILIARQTGNARDFFALGIVRSGAIALVLFVSVAIRRPLAGYVWNFFSPVAGWRAQPRLVRMFGWITAWWAISFALKFALEGALYLADNTGMLGTVRIVLGYPLTFGLLLMTYLVASRATGQERRIRLPGRLGR